MLSQEISKRWVDFFAKRGHTVVPSTSLISNEPGAMFTIAGMVPFIPYFLGRETPPFSRATSVQKCIRTLDIDEVGKTARHGTFFQMAGNFSFGDYFKEQAIPFAYELLTTSQDEGGYGLDPERLWVTIYEGDDQAFDVWTKIVGFPEERIQRMGMKENYWSTGQPGPAGPDSEIFYDRGPAYGKEGGPAVDDDRYIEIWNLVFMQYQRGEGTGKDDFEILSVLRCCCRGSRTSMRPTRYARYLMRHRNYPVKNTMGLNPPRMKGMLTMCGCAWSPTISALHSCSSLTG